MPQPTLTSILHFLRSTCEADADRDLPDADLLERFLIHREEAAFALLLQRHGPMVLAVCRRVLGDPHIAEDAFQATFLILVRRAGSIRKKTSLGSWLHGVAHRVAVRARVRTAARDRRERQAPLMPRSQPLDEVTLHELRAVLDEEIARLPEKYQAAVVHCCLEGQSYDQAARELGWPKNSLAKRLTRARELLRGQLAQRGVTLSAAALAVVLGEKASAAPLTARLTINTVAAAAGNVPAGNLSARVAALVEDASIPALGIKGKLALIFLLLGLAAAGLAAPGALPEQSPPTPALAAVAPVLASGPAKKDPLLDLHGDSLPDGATGRLGTVRFRGGSRVSGLTLAPGGKVLAASAVAGFGLSLWDMATGRPLYRFDVPFICEKPPAFSPDGKTVVVAGKFRGGLGKLYLFEVATGKELGRFEGPAGASLDCVAFSSDGRTLAAGESGGAGPAIVFWDVATGQEIRRLAGHTDMIQSVAFSPDGKLLVSGSEDRTVRLWEVATDKELRRLAEQPRGVVAVEFAPDGQTLASVGQDGVVRLWDVGTGKELHRLRVDDGHLQTFAISPDGKVLATGEMSGWVRLWDPATGKELRRWQANSRWISAVAFVRGGTVLATAGTWEHAIRLWATATGKEIQPLAGHTGMVEWVRFAADGKSLLSAGRDSQVLEWDPATGRQRRLLIAGPLAPDETQYPATVTCDLSPDRKILARATKYGWEPKHFVIHLRDTTAGKELRTLAGHTASVVWLRFSPDGRLLASGADDGTRVWDVATGKELYRLPGNAGAAFSPDGRLLAGGGQNDRTIRLWDAATGKELRRWDSDQAEMWRIQFSPDGTLLASSGASGSGAAIWAVATGKQVASFGIRGFIDDVAFSPSGRVFAASVRSGRLLDNGERHETSVIHLWEVLSGQEIRRIEVVQGSVWALAIATDGRTLASGGSDSTILLWDLTGGLKSEPPGELATLWTALAGDAAAADRALWMLVRSPKQSVPFLADRLRPVPPADAKVVAGLVSDLGSDTFAVRKAAARKLAEMGEAAEPALRKALEGNPPLEVRQQVEVLLSKRGQETLRQLRAIETLEHIGTAEARKVLDGLAQTAPNPSVAQAARAAAKRLTP
jgi:RNA polymerase sigma factor (sigma-70 family)